MHYNWRVPKSVGTLAGFLIVVAIAILFRLCGLTFDSLWLDEGYQTVVDAHGHGMPDLLTVPDRSFIFNPGPPAPISVMLENFRSVDPLTPPLYQVVLNRWITLAGGSDASLRSLSVLVSVVGVAALYTCCQLLLGTRCAFIAGLLQAVSPFDVYYGQEVRMYGLVELAALLCCGSLLIYLRWQHSLGKRALLLSLHAIGAWMVINAHYTGLFIAAFCVLLGLFVGVVRKSSSTIVELLVAWLGALLLWLPWWQMFVQAASMRTASFYVSRTPSWWWPIAGLLHIVENWFTFLAGKQVVGFAIPLYVTAAGLLAVACVRWLPLHAVRRLFDSDRDLPRTARLVVLALFGWAVLPALLIWLIDVIESHRVVEISRYLIGTAPAVFMLCAVGVSALRPKVAATLLICHCALASINNFAHATIIHQREPWREMAALVEEKVSPEEPLLVSQYYDIVCLDRYLRVPYRQVGVSGITTTEQLNRILNGAPSFGLVTAQEGDRIVAAVPRNYHLTYARDLGHSLHLFLYERLN